jgi:hypothetical protein
MKRAFLHNQLLAAGIVLLAAAGQAAAQIPRCAPRAEMVATLNQTFSESHQALGFLSPSLLLEVFVSDGGGFTIVVTGTDGVSCVLAVGVGWENMPPAGDGVGL